MPGEQELVVRAKRRAERVRDALGLPVLGQFIEELGEALEIVSARVQELEGERDKWREAERKGKEGGRVTYRRLVQEKQAAESHLARLEEALRELIDEAVAMDHQIDQEFGVPSMDGPFKEAEAITKARSALTSACRAR